MVLYCHTKSTLVLVVVAVSTSLTVVLLINLPQPLNRSEASLVWIEPFRIIGDHLMTINWTLLQYVVLASNSFHCNDQTHDKSGIIRNEIFKDLFKFVFKEILWVHPIKRYFVNLEIDLKISYRAIKKTSFGS